MYIIVDFNDDILFWTNDDQELDYILWKKYINKYAYVYKLNFHEHTMKVVYSWDD